MKNIKSLGQNWLKDRATLEEIAGYAIGPALCVEIGPGLGTLTSSLLRRFEKVVAVEFDENLARNLPKSFPGKNLEVVNEDILRFDFSGIDAPYAVAGNIPYYITSPILRRLLEITPAPERIVLLVQKEVAERVAAGEGEQNVLALTVQNRARVVLGPVVRRELFTPAPKVDSQVLILEPYAESDGAIMEDGLAKRVPGAALTLAKIGFSNPRKKLIGNLTRGLGLPKERLAENFIKLGLSLDARPADLLLADWENLRRALGDNKNLMEKNNE